MRAARWCGRTHRFFNSAMPDQPGTCISSLIATPSGTMSLPLRRTGCTNCPANPPSDDWTARRSPRKLAGCWTETGRPPVLPAEADAGCLQNLSEVAPKRLGVSRARRRPSAVSLGVGSETAFAYTPSPARTPSAAPLSAAAQSEESFLPFAARVAFASACLSAFFARLSSFRAFLAGLAAAWSMKFAALVSFAPTGAGIV